MLIPVLTLWLTLITRETLSRDLPILPAILWDPRNPFFACDDNTVTVAIGDKLNFVCPNKGMNLEGLASDPRTDELYETAYLLDPDSEENFNKCNATGSRQILSCDGNSKQLDYNQLSFKQFSGSSSAILFDAGKTYYMIGTAFRKRENIGNTVGGSCQKTDFVGPYRLRMKIRVCSQDEVFVYKNCTRCTTASCYYKGCTRCGSWFNTGSSITPDAENKCYTRYERKCRNNKTDITYIETNKTSIPCPTTQAPQTTKAPTPAITTQGATKSLPKLAPRTGDEGKVDSYFLGVIAAACLLIGFVVGFVCQVCLHKRRKERSSVESCTKSEGTVNPAYSTDTLDVKAISKEPNGTAYYERESVDIKLVDNDKNCNTHISGNGDRKF